MDLPAVPVELVHSILEIAAQDYVAERRSWALQLALLNRSIARLLRPILFYSVIIDPHNEEYFAAPGPSDTVLSLARHLSIIPSVDGELAAIILTRWKPAVGSFLLADWSLLYEFMDNPDAEALRAVEVRYERLMPAFAGQRNPAPANVARQLTRVAGYIPLHWSFDGPGDPVVSAREWAAMLCDKLPALAHLGLDLDDELDPRWVIDTVDHALGVKTPLEQYLNKLSDVLIALLDIRPRLRICIRVGGEFIKHRPLIQQIVVEGVPNSRLRVNYDLVVRRSVDFSEEHGACTQDAWKGRDIWTVIKVD